MADASGALKRAMRFAKRAKHCRSEPDRRSTWRQTIDALYSALPPKADGTHPLDARNLKLRGD